MPGTITCFLCPKLIFYDQKFWGVLPEKLGGGVRHISWNLTLFQTKISDFPYHISDLFKNLISYFRPEALEPSTWPERVTSCYGTYTLVGVNIIREMVLSEKHTQFKTRVHKPYPISDQNGLNWYPISDHIHCTYIAYIRDSPSPPPPRAENALQIMSLTAYASETN